MSQIIQTSPSSYGHSIFPRSPRDQALDPIHIFPCPNMGTDNCYSLDERQLLAFEVKLTVICGRLSTMSACLAVTLSPYFTKQRLSISQDPQSRP
jgi:hypothetical protein